MGALACVLFCAAGHFFRDGTPPTGSTQLARASGALICGIGFLFVTSPLNALIVGLTILVSFYADQKHGEGQGAATLKDAGYLMLSGVSSFVPVAAVCAYLTHPLAGLIVFCGLLKPAIWFAWNKIHWPDDTAGKFFGLSVHWTALAAATFGALIGASIALVCALAGASPA